VTSGILLVDKPQGVTSHDVVARARRVLGTRKVGHAGTLDPMATGLLVLGVDSATRLLTYLVGLSKEYTATIRLGASTTTDDAEGELAGGSDASALARADVDRGIAALTGAISQVPSTYSAIKVDGRRSYDLARSGSPVELAARTVTISAFEVLAERRESTFLDLDVRIECSSGTYIRALARDLGAGLAVGGHLTALRRTRVGPFRVEDAVADPEALPGALRTPASIAAQLFPTTTLDAAELRDLAHGKKLELDVPDTEVLAALSGEGRLVGLIAVKKGAARVLVNFPTSEVLA
jgi:tRNA pseudouridine55 synthase